MRALVIDDSRALRLILGRMLRNIGFEVSEADGGESALALLGRETFDIALVDWNMPGMDGLQVVLAMRANHALDGMRIMMVTTENEIEKIVSSLSAGANEFLMKPFTSEAVVEKLALLGLWEAA